MRRSRAIVPILLAGPLLGCWNTAYIARMPAARGTTEVPSEISHCLASVGFEDVSSQERWAEFIQEDPELHAVWVLSLTRASVLREEERWRIVFVSHGGASGESKLLSEAFSGCIPTHAPAISVEVESNWFIDLR